LKYETIEREKSIGCETLTFDRSHFILNPFWLGGGGGE
jgi:hypothetical protein